MFFFTSNLNSGYFLARTPGPNAGQFQAASKHSGASFRVYPEDNHQPRQPRLCRSSKFASPGRGVYRRSPNHFPPGSVAIYQAILPTGRKGRRPRVLNFLDMTQARSSYAPFLVPGLDDNIRRYNSPRNNTRRNVTTLVATAENVEEGQTHGNTKTGVHRGGGRRDA